jgi:hypothetical protein
LADALAAADGHALLTQTIPHNPRAQNTKPALKNSHFTMALRGWRNGILRHRLVEAHPAVRAEVSPTMLTVYARQQGGPTAERPGTLRALHSSLEPEDAPSHQERTDRTTNQKFRRTPMFTFEHSAQGGREYERQADEQNPAALSEAATEMVADGFGHRSLRDRRTRARHGLVEINAAVWARGRDSERLCSEVERFAALRALQARSDLDANSHKDEPGESQHRGHFAILTDYILAASIGHEPQHNQPCSDDEDRGDPPLAAVEIFAHGFVHARVPSPLHDQIWS